MRELEEEMFNTGEQEYSKYCALLDRFSPLLHPNHYQLLLLKRYLANSIRGNISLDMVEVKQRDFASPLITMIGVSCREK